MHAQSQFKIISENANGYIGVCDCCQQYNFVFNNLFIVFQEDELLNFLDWLRYNRSSKECQMMLHNGRNKLYTSPHTNLFLAFNDEELDEIETMAGEVKLLLDARRILKRNG